MADVAEVAGTPTDRRQPRRDGTRTPTDLRLLGPAVLAWALAAATLGLAPTAHLVVAASAAVAGGLVLAVLRRRATAWQWPALILCLLVVLLQSAAAGHAVLRDRGGVAALADARAVVTAELVVTGDPVVLAGRGDSAQVLREATMQRVDARGASRTTAAPVLLTGDDRLVALPWRSTVRVSGRLGPTDPADDRAATLSLSGAPRVIAPPGTIAAAAERLRAGLRTAVDHAPEDARGLLPGLVIGDTSRTPEDLTEAMRATGMTHLTAVSGSNVAVVTGLVLGLCILVGIPRALRPVLAMVALAGFVVLARPEPSVVRAAVMGAIGLIGLSRSRRSAGPPVLGAAIIVVLVLDPWLARSFGFALSSLATLGLLLFTRPWGEAIGTRLPPRLAPLGPALAVPVAAQAMTAPVIVLLQGSVSVVGILANLLAAPLVPIATVAGVAAALLSVVWPGGAVLVAWVGIVPTTGIAQVARHFAQVPGGTMPWPDGWPGAVLLAGLTLLVLLTGRALAAGVAAHPALTVGAAVLLAAALLPTRTVTWPPDGWRVVVCDVGQGDAVVLRTGPGSAVLVDTGPDPPLVDGCLDRLGVATLDAVVLTHLHADHVDGLAGALDGRTVRQLLVGPVAEPAAADVQVRRLAGQRHIPVVVLHASDRLRLGELDAVVWSPVRRIAAGSVPNNASLVLAARTGTVDALLLGDIERESAHDLLLRLRREPSMAAAARGFEVVKTPHHGSANLDDDLMAAVRSPLGVISVGADNDYGHPSPRHLDVLRRNGYTVLRTDRDGDVAVVERGGVVSAVTTR
ncbi:ComEC/Rec2 family competence protein [Oryzobacter telluris]|uniref:ComEC/Rec2 family competence protein n=1 Tax=Oryzobacter telluris TaxID=3149179 RepID=UPI00370D10E6